MAVLSRPVTYTRGGQSKTVQAVRAGDSWNDINRSGGTALLQSSRDFIVKKSALGFDPEVRDTLRDGGEVWTVYCIIQGECWWPLGDTSLIRIHCKR